MKRRICIFTGTRAEYGLLRPLIEELFNKDRCKLQLLVSGTHLAGDFGLTYRDIEKDGFCIDSKIDIRLTSDSPEAIARSLGTGIALYCKEIKKLAPDILVILGDRFEAFAAAAAATIAKIPIAHLSGGEATFGLMDEAFRHCITKMSHLHFTSTETYRKRVIQLGESPSRVFAVGALGLDNIKRLKLLSKEELERALVFKFNKRNILVTFHPATLDDDARGSQFRNLLGALDMLKDTNIIFTKANADPGGRIINSMIDSYARKRKKGCIVFASMGQIKYLSTMQFVDAVVGNSSSGIIEAPSFKIGTINIGDRQKGRLRASSIIDCASTKRDIIRAFGILYSADFAKILSHVNNPYGDGAAAPRISRVLIRHDLGRILKKDFYDIV